MSVLNNTPLQLNLAQRPTIRKCPGCTRFNKVCNHVSEPKEDDPTRAYIKIHTGTNENGWEPVIACLDTGTKAEWVSGETVKRFQNPDIVPLTPPETYAAFQGDSYKATKAVWITWHTLKNQKTRKGLFRVVENGPFDVIIGSKLLFEQGIFAFNEAALLFFHRKPNLGEEHRMQQTLAEQTAEVRQYTADRSVNQDHVHQQERAELDSNSIPRAPQTAYRSPPGMQSAQRSDSYTYNTGPQCPSYKYNASNPRASPYPQQGVTYTSCAAPSPPIHHTAGGTQRSGFPAASASSLRQDPRTISGPPSPYTINASTLTPGYGISYSPPPTPIHHTAGGTQRSEFPAASASSLRQDPRTISGPPSPYTVNASTLTPGYGIPYSPPPTEGGQGSQRWTCSKCSNRNDPTRNPENCNACSASRGSRPRLDGRDKRV